MRKFLYLILVIGLSGCTDGLGMGVGSDVRGSYELESVNGRRLPYPLSDYGGVRESIYSGQMRFESDGYFTETLQIEVNDYGYVSRYTHRDTGEYEVDSRGRIVLYYDMGDVLEGEYSSRDLRIYGSGQTVVYRRY